MKVTRTSDASGVTRTLDINITDEQLKIIESGESAIQKIVPHLTDDEREFILTGIMPDEWDELFGEND